MKLSKNAEKNKASGPIRALGMNRTSVLFVLALLLNVFAVSVYAQSSQITGTVTDQEGIPLPGATVLVKGTTNGAQTDFDGNYSIEAATGDVLVFSYIGFTAQEVEITDQTVIDVMLSQSTAVLDEVVVTGYGRQSRSTLTSSVAKLDTKVLESATRSNPATALQGTVAGLRVTNTTGQPGATPQVVLRGGTNFDGSDSPLILVDGVPSSFFALNSDDIESMEVLKDAAATAIYGARSANGVILITTKKGKAGRSSINY